MCYTTARVFVLRIRVSCAFPTHCTCVEFKLRMKRESTCFETHEYSLAALKRVSTIKYAFLSLANQIVFYNAVMRKPIKIELTLLNVNIVIQGLTLLWIFLIRLVLQISIPVSFEVLKPSLNQISHSIHWSIFLADYHDFSADIWMELFKSKKWIYNSKITSIFIRYRPIVNLF